MRAWPLSETTVLAAPDAGYNSKSFGAEAKQHPFNANIINIGRRPVPKLGSLMLSNGEPVVQFRYIGAYARMANQRWRFMCCDILSVTALL